MSDRLVRFSEETRVIPISPPDRPGPSNQKRHSLAALPLSSAYTAEDDQRLRILINSEPFIPLDMHTAASVADQQTVQQCIQRGYDLNDVNSSGWTPLMYAAYIGHKSICQCLLSSGAVTERRNPRQQTALSLAASCGNDAVLQMLIEAGADLESPDLRGWTPLYQAVSSNQLNATRRLLEAGASPLVSDNLTSLSVTELALTEGLEMIAELLFKYESDWKPKRAPKMGWLDKIRPLSVRNEQHPAITDGPSQAQKLFSEPKKAVQQKSLERKNSHPSDQPSGEPETLEELLNQLQLSKYYTFFQQVDANLERFLDMDDARLKEIGIKLFGPRKKMLNSIDRYLTEGTFLSPLNARK